MLSRHRSFSLVFLFTLGLYPATLSHSQTPHAIDTGLRGGYSLNGYLLLPSGKRVDRRIRIKLEMTFRANVIGTTNEVGNFRFVGMIPGDYILHVEESEFAPLSVPITIHESIGGPSGPMEVSIRLTHKNPPAAVPPAALEHFNKAGELTKAGNHKGAIDELKLALEAHPEFVQGLNELGVQYMKIGDLPRSRDALRSVLKIDPNSMAALVNLGMVYFLLKEYEAAAAPLRRALKLDNRSAVAHYFLGQALANRGKFGEAEKELKAALEQGGDEMKEAHRILAIIYNSRGDKKLAIDHLENYLRLAPNAEDADQLRSVLQKLKGKE